MACEASWKIRCMASRKDYYTYTHLFTLAGFGASGNSNFEHGDLKSNKFVYSRYLFIETNVYVEGSSKRLSRGYEDDKKLCWAERK